MTHANQNICLAEYHPKLRFHVQDGGGHKTPAQGFLTLVLFPKFNSWMEAVNFLRGMV